MKQHQPHPSISIPSLPSADPSPHPAPPLK